MTVTGTLRTALLAAACGVASTFVPAPPLCTPMGASVLEKSSGFSRTPPAAIPQLRAGRDPSTQTLDRIPSASLSGDEDGGDALGPVGCLPDIKEVVSEEDASRALHMFQMFDSFRQRLSAEEKFAKV